MTDDRDDPPAQDPWLQAALRHAPDADAAAPPALSAAILRQARAATVPSAPSVGQRLVAVWGWLVSPPVATGLASLMVVTVAGLMWWDRPMDEALPPREAPVTVAQAPAPAATPAAESTADAAALAQPTAAAPAAAPPAKAAAPEGRRRESAGLTALRKSEAEVAAAPPPPETAMVPPAVAADAGRAAEAPVDTLRRTAAAAPRALGASGGARVTPSRAATPDPAPASARPLKELQIAMALHPDRWRWQRGNGLAQGVGAATWGWLDQLEHVAVWRPSSLAPVAADASTLSWYRDGRLYARLQLQAGAAVCELAGKPVARWRAELSADDTAALAAALDAALK